MKIVSSMFTLRSRSLHKTVNEFPIPWNKITHFNFVESGYVRVRYLYSFIKQCGRGGAVLSLMLANFVKTKVTFFCDVSSGLLIYIGQTTVKKWKFMYCRQS